jgi:hypothetical protein
MRAICPAYLIFPNLITLIISGEAYEWWSSSLRSLHHSPGISFLTSLFSELEIVLCSVITGDRPLETPLNPTAPDKALVRGRGIYPCVLLHSGVSSIWSSTMPWRRIREWRYSSTHF